MTPRLSVLMPAFNRSHWLAGALDSVLEPGLDLELVVVDNGSADGTWALLEARAARDPRLRIVRWEVNDGAEVFPALLEMARGEYVNFFADDDQMLPGGLARKMAVLDRHPEVGLVFTPVRCMDAAGADQGEGAWTVIAPEDFTGRDDLFPSLILGNFVPMPAAMFRRALAPGGGILRDGTWMSSRDWPFWLDLVRRTRVAYLREPAVRLRMHPGQETMVEGVARGSFQEVRLRVWKHWMLEAEPPFVPSAAAWSGMARSLFGDLRATHGENMMPVREGLRRLQALRDAQDAALARAREAREAGLPEAFLLEPDWSREDWQETLRVFAATFNREDPVALLLLQEPPGSGPESVAWVLAGTRRTDLPEVRVLGNQQLLPALRRFVHHQWLAAAAPLQGAKGRRLAEALKSGVQS